MQTPQMQTPPPPPDPGCRPPSPLWTEWLTDALKTLPSLAVGNELSFIVMTMELRSSRGTLLNCACVLPCVSRKSETGKLRTITILMAEARKTKAGNSRIIIPGHWFQRKHLFFDLFHCHSVTCYFIVQLLMFF